jgi:hypothetical protein
MKNIKLILLVSWFPVLVQAQNYTSTNGSSYIGSLNVHNNPSAIINSPFKWDLTLFGLQDKHTTNTIRVFKYSLLSNPAKSEYMISGGQFSRHADLNLNLNLFNTRIALNKRSAIAFGANLRSYVTLTSGPYNYLDSISKFGHFFGLNEGAQNMKVNMASSSWAELYASYGQTIIDNEYGRLNAGITLKLNKGLSGAFAHLNNGNFIRTGSNPPSYRVTDASLDFGYSSNFDEWDSLKNFGQNSRNFFSLTEAGGSIDIGAEWLVKLQSTRSVYDDDDYFDYDWKIGLSVLDIGYGQYAFGQYSTRARNINSNVTDVLLDQVFDSTISSVGILRDSLSRVFGDMGRYIGKFRVTHPTRLVLNVDKFITDAFFVNADISVNVSSLSSGPNKRVSDMNVITLTPRWETRKKGFYLPVYFNTRNQLWIGGAVRLGPVLFGVHNWSNIFSTKKIQRGGGYLAIILKAADITGNKNDRRMECFE